ncbi:hypothetical protein HZB02_02240 [Candidatus Woesearchaeota archaeon]|nr:hypothetical protein [Candidatus Woesearchaeota archaeon]
MRKRILQILALAMIFLMISLTPVIALEFSEQSQQIGTPLLAGSGNNDTTPPLLTLNETPKITQKPTLELSGSVDEQSTLRISVLSSRQQDDLPPAKVAGLVLREAAADKVTVDWTPSNERDKRGYVIYRTDVGGSGILNFVQGATYTDENVSSGTSYNYRVAAIDINCNIGIGSDTLNAQTKNGTTVHPVPVPYNLSKMCLQQADVTTTVNGNFVQTINLHDGKNTIKIEAEDAAGNIATLQRTVVLDATAPQILSPTQITDEYSPVYLPFVELNGKISENATVLLYLNNDSSPTYTTTTDDDGSFKKEITLRLDVTFNCEENFGNRQGGFGGGTGGGTGQPPGSFWPQRSLAQTEQFWSQYCQYFTGSIWINHVKIVAQDKAGTNSTAVEGDIVFATCGKGAWWDVNMTKVSPQVLTPSLIARGMGQAGFGYNVGWTVGDEPGRISSIRIDAPPLSRRDQEKYDFDWVNIVPEYKLNENGTGASGYVALNIKKINPSKPGQKNLTMYEIEKNISEHNKGRCLLPGYGCIRVPLMMEISFQSQYYSGTQRVCMLPPVEVAIDARISPQVIPDSFLKRSIAFFNNLIKGIEAVEEPVKIVMQATAIVCAVSLIALYIVYVREQWNCKWSKTIGALTGGGFDVNVAKTGMCTAKYGDETVNGNKDKKDVCVQCQAALEQSKKWEERMKWICDRITCPSAPTLQKYIRDAKSKGKGTGFKIGGTTYYTGNDCADPSIQPGYSYGAKAPITVLTGMGGRSTTGGKPFGIKEVYQSYLEYKDGKAVPVATPISTDGKTVEIKCDAAHPMTAACCGQSYVDEWNSACLVENEIKDSFCLSGQLTTDSRNKPATDTAPADTFYQDQCSTARRVWNSIAGFCEASGKPKPDLVHSGWVCKPGACIQEDSYSSGTATPPPEIICGKCSTYNTKTKKCDWGFKEDDDECKAYKAEVGNPTYTTAKDVGQLGSTREIVYRIIPEGSIDTGLLTSTSERTIVQRGYVIERDKLSSINLEESENEALVINNRYFVNLKTLDGSMIATTMQGDEYNKGKEAFTADLKRVGQQYSRSPEDIYREILAKAGAKERDYIVEPTSGMFRSAQCACLPAFRGYLQFYKGLFGAVRTCFESLLYTGDGKAGVCQQVLSVYVCDLFYDLISCFQKRYSAGPGGSVKGGGISGVLGSLTGAGSRIAETVTNRYGKTSTFQSLFGQRQLANAVCIWAFTGDFVFDFQSALEQNFNVPLESKGFAAACHRRFVSYDPSSAPSGLATFEYDTGVGLVAGADLTYRIYLKCSADYSCDPSQGFEGGKCDCAETGEQMYPLMGQPGITGSLRKGQVLDAAPFISIPGKQKKVRFDKAILEWTYQNNDKERVTKKAECDVKQQGGDAPAYCSFDMANVAYRCDLNTGNDFWAKFNNPPKPRSEYFAKGEKLNFDFDVTQKIPQNPSCTGEECEYTKYLGYEVKNAQGFVITSSDEKNDFLRLNTDGKWFPNKDVTGYVLTEADFVRKEKKNECTAVSGRTDVVDSCGTTSTRLGIIKITKTSDPAPTKKYTCVPMTKDISGTYKEITDPGFSCECKEIEGGNIGCTGMLIYLKSSVEFKPSESLVIEAKEGTPVTEGSTTPCSDNPGKELEFEATFRIFDAMQTDSGVYTRSRQPTQYNNKEQKQTIRFKVRCSKGDINGGEATKAIGPQCRFNEALNIDACYCLSRDRYTQLLNNAVNDAGIAAAKTLLNCGVSTDTTKFPTKSDPRNVGNFCCVAGAQTPVCSTLPCCDSSGQSFAPSGGCLCGSATCNAAAPYCYLQVPETGYGCHTNKTTPAGSV